MTYPDSSNMVDQGAALLLTSVERATRLRIPAERWVYPDWHRRPRHGMTPRNPSGVDHSDRRCPGAHRTGWVGLDDINTSTCIRAFPPLSKVAAIELGWTQA